ncbi:hypothetical protein GCM10023185_42900 [Hymenobacter saemangeumensis]|uniref:Putative zinc-finger domain-containing protein n=1 Tax=Hymenobacter saemangeumensis TaxID=1084522 RepID=A0ABP8IRT7_9BACT
MHSLTHCDEIEALLPAYADRSLPAADAELVAAHLPSCPACQRQLQQLHTLSAELDAAMPEVPRTALRANFMAMLDEQKALLGQQPAAAPAPAPVAPSPKVVAMWPSALASPLMRIAAAILLVVGGVLLGRNLPGFGGQAGSVATNPAPAQPEASASGQRLATVLAGNTRQPVSASDRIELVNATRAEVTPGDPTVQVLINTLNFDPNANVRLAACEALFQLRADPRVAEAFVHSLPIQTDPNVQITLIELLVALRDPRAVRSLERLSRRQDALPVVRDQAKAGLGKLI